MSWLSKGIKSIAKGAKKLVTNPGDWVSSIAHQATDPKTLLSVAGALALPGVGGVLGAIPGVGAVTGALGSAASGIGGALSSIPGVGKIMSVADAIGDSSLGQAARVLNGGKAITAGNLLGGAEKNISDIASGGASGVSDLLGKVGGVLTGNGGLNALGIAQGVNTALQQQKADGLANDALSSVKDSYNERAPLRAQGIAGLLNPQTQDLSSLHTIAGSLQPSTLQPSAPQDVSGLQSIQSLLQPTPVKGGPLASFQAPPKPAPTSVAALTNDPGNPYAKKVA